MKTLPELPPMLRHLIVRHQIQKRMDFLIVMLRVTEQTSFQFSDQFSDGTLCDMIQIGHHPVISIRILQCPLFGAVSIMVRDHVLTAPEDVFISQQIIGRRTAEDGNQDIGGVAVAVPGEQRIVQHRFDDLRDITNSRDHRVRIDADHSHRVCHLMVIHIRTISDIQ